MTSQRSSKEKSKTSAPYHAADRRTADRLAPARAGAMRTDQAGIYLTDEVFLYRVAGLVAGAAGEMLEVEDCYWLDVVRAPVRDVRACQRRVVTPAAAQG